MSATMDIVARLKLAGSEFAHEFKNQMGMVETEARATSNRVGSSFKAIGGMIAGAVAGISVTEIAALAKRAVDYASALGEVSQQLGVNTKELQTYRFIASQVGVEQEEMDRSLGHLTQTIGKAATGGAQQSRVFKALGIDIRTAGGDIKSAGDVIPELADRLAKIPDAATRAAVEVQLFGETGQKLETMLAGGRGEIDALAKEAERLGYVLSDEAIQKADQIADKLAMVKSVLEARIASIVLDNADSIMRLADSFANIAARAPDAIRWMRQLDNYAQIGMANFRKYEGMAYQKIGGRPEVRARGQRERFDAENDIARLDMERKFGLTAQDLIAPRLTVAPRAPVGGGGIDLSAPTKSRGGGRTHSAGKSDAEKAAEEQIKLTERLKDALQDAVDTEASGLHVLGLKLQDREDEAELAEKLADLQRRYGDDLKKMTPAEAKRTQEVDDQLALYQQQADALAALIAGSSDAKQLAAEHGAEVQALVDGMIAAVAAADKQKKTAQDLYDIAEAQVRVEVQLAQATEKQADNKKHAAEWTAMARDIDEEAAREAEENMKRIEDMRRDQVRDLADMYETLFRDGSKGLWRDFKDMGRAAIADIAAQWTVAMLTGQDSSLGGILGQINAGGAGGGNPLLKALGGLLGGHGGGDHVGTYGSDTGEFEPGGGGAAGLPVDMGGTLGSLSSKVFGSGVGGAISSAVPYIGLALAAMPILKDLFGGVFSSTKKGMATIGFNQYGELGVTSTRGNSDKRIGAATGAAGGVIDALQQIADAVGGSLSGTPSVSIGMRKDSWRVDPTGGGNTKTSKGAIDFGKDQEAAIRYAISDALRDGVIAGISDASKRILASGQDLQKAIEKAVLIESIPKMLKERLDPLGSAMDELNERWSKVWAALKEGAASAEQMAQAQQLYNLELKDVQDSVGDALDGTADSLKAFLRDLHAGSSSPYSLRDQEAAAQQALQPFLDKIAGGQAIDQQAYLDAAQTYLDIERQLNGSTEAFFQALDMIQAATNQAIGTIEGVTPISTAADPYLQATANATQQTASNTAAAADIGAETRNEIIGLRGDVQGLTAAIGARVGFVGTGTGFSAAA